MLLLKHFFFTVTVTDSLCVQRKCVFEYFAALASHLGPKISCHLKTIISPLYRVTEGTEEGYKSAAGRVAEETCFIIENI